MATTYELLDELRDLTAEIERCEADLAACPEEQTDLYLSYEKELDTAMLRLEDWYSTAMPSKVAALLAFAKESKSQVALAKDQAKDWTACAKRRSLRADRCSLLAVQLLEANGGPVDMPGGRRAHVVERTSVSVNVTSVEDLTSDYCKVSKVADKKAIAAALKAGKVVTGAELVSRQSFTVSVKDK